jgi:methylmalonyl-CoA mutase cobalamin-binding subunit
LKEYGREDVPFQMVLGGPVTSVDDVRRWEDIGVTRMIVSPWKRSPEAIEAMHRFAESYLTD